MLPLLLIVSLLPLAAFAVSRRFSRENEPWLRTAARVLLLFAIGLFIAAPFLTRRGVGTGEAYNYSLAVADAVTQMRAGEFPPLAGQTEYAFNGRIHPLRNAPYLFYLAGGLDLLSFRQLTFWQLQNLSLALSLVAAVFACYAGLRWGLGCGRPAALALAALYGLSPGLLAATSINLFMTVHAAVFVPLALGACWRQTHRPAVGNDLVLAITVAAAWLAHPPVAFCLTAVVVPVRAIILWRHPAWQVRAGLLGALVLGLALAAFVFVSAATLDSQVDYFRDEQVIHDNYVTSILSNLRLAFPGALLPVSARADALTDFQFGYAFWGLLLAALVGLAVQWRRSRDEAACTRWLAACGLALATLLLLAFTLPVPQLTPWLWDQVPISVQTLINVWPMQRTYLVAAAAAIFAAAGIWHSQPRTSRTSGVFVTLFVLALGWTGWEARAFVQRNHDLLWSSDDTRRSHLSSNLDLTITSYSFLAVPATFVNGVMDPLFEFRLLKSGHEEIDSPLQAALAHAPVVARGDIFRRDDPSGSAAETSAQQLILEPGKRYLLSFDFPIPALQGELEVKGPSLLRHYSLPSAGGPKGFGTGPAQRHALSIWTAQDHPEPVEVRLAVSKWPANAPDQKLASFSLLAVDSARLPVQLESLLPLRCWVEAPEAGCVLSTPRSYLPAYVATVNGRVVRGSRSPDGQLMVPVPAGRSMVEIRYVGAPAVRAAFFVSLVAWAGLLVWAIGYVCGFDWIALLVRGWRPSSWISPGVLRFYKPLLATVALAAGVIAFRIQHQTYLDSVGPVHLRFMLPSKQTGRQQPLVVTGRAGAGTDVFVGYLDKDHVQIGADIWGTLYKSEPIPVDYFQEQDLVVNSSGLYPLDHPVVQSLSPLLREKLRQDFRVEFNGQIVIHQQRSAYESKVREVTIGKSLIGDSLTQPLFSGEILSAGRLPLPRSFVLLREQSLRLQVRFPFNHGGVTETLLSLGPEGENGVCTVTYQGDRHVLLAYRTRDGQVVASVEHECDTTREHELEFAFGRPSAASPATPLAVRWKFDGQTILGPDALEPLTHPSLVLVGMAEADTSGVERRFTGAKIAGTLVTAGAKETVGPMRLAVTLPSDKLGRAEPLVTSGKNRRGDFAYVTYLDSGHVRLGLDHWGVGGAVSDPIALDYRAPHAIEVRMGSLYPDEKDPAWGSVDPAIRHQLKSSMEIILDGVRVLKAPLPAYPSTPEEITPGENRIEGSSCEPTFSGEIHSAVFLGLKP